MPSKPSLLVVDDEPELVAILVEYFCGQGFEVRSAGNAVAARAAFDSALPQLCILDIHMPGEDGLSLARWIRQQHGSVGIIMLTTAADVVDRIVGLEMGADDYVSKPFELRELLARAKSVMRRLTEKNPAPQTDQAKPGRIRFGRCELDLEMRVLLDEQGDSTALTAMEFDLLKVFAANAGRVLNRDQLMELAHHKGWDVFDRSIDLRIMRLRRKIEPDPEKPEVIKTVRGVGYMFIAETNL
ncbi:MAG: response regulator [Spongiibacteraceae bacterium]